MDINIKEYLENERNREVLMRTINDYEKCVKAIPTVKEIVKRFDGKVYNKKLNDALGDAFNYEKNGYHIGCHKDTFDPHIIDIYLYNNGSTTLARINMKEMPEGKRIDAAMWNAKLEKNEKYYSKKVKEIEECIPKVNEYRNQLKKLQDAALDIYKKIPSELHEAFYIGYPRLN